MGERPVVIYETKGFSRRFGKLIGDEGRRPLYRHLESSPKSGDIIAGSGGIRKLRWSRPGTGKRGGIRVVYYFFDARGLVALLTVYAKNEQEDLPKQELLLMRSIVERMKSEMDGEGDG